MSDVLVVGCQDRSSIFSILDVELGGACDSLLRAGDVIVSINGIVVNRLRHSDVHELLTRAGTSVDIVVLREDEEDKVHVSNLSSMNYPGSHENPAHFQSYHPPQGPRVAQQVPAPMKRTVELDGLRKEVVSQQFNSPLNLYSDDTLTDVAIANINAGMPVDGSNVVPASKPHLPVPKEGNFSKPHDSATFKMVLESEMAEARRKEAVYGSEFAGHRAAVNRHVQGAHQADPVMLDNSINQSSSFKRLMNSMAHQE